VIVGNSPYEPPVDDFQGAVASSCCCCAVEEIVKLSDTRSGCVATRKAYFTAPVTPALPGGKLSVNSAVVTPSGFVRIFSTAGIGCT
jgi:hypothetical protein